MSGPPASQTTAPTENAVSEGGQRRESSMARRSMARSRPPSPAALTGALRAARSPVLPLGPVVQHRHPADLADPLQAQRAARAVGEHARAGEPGGGGVADEERGDRQPQLVGE